MAVNRTQETEPFFASIMEHVSDALIFVDMQGLIIRWNVAAERLYGWTAEEVVGKPFAEIVQTHYPHTHRDEARQEVMQTGYWSGEVIQLRKDGTPLPIWSSVSTVKDENGKIIGLMGINRDLTRRKQAEEALQQSEKTYRYLFANHPHPMWIYDLHTLAFLEVNEAAITKYGYSRAEFLQMTIQTIRPPEDMPLLMKNLAQERQSQENSEEWRHRLKDGRVIDVSITSHTLQFHGHEAALIIAEDITERKQAEKAIIESEQNIRTLFDTVAEGIALNEIIYNENGEMVDYRILNVNKAFYATADYTGTTVVGNVATKLYGMTSDFIKSFWKEHLAKNTTAFTEMVSPLNKLTFFVATSPFFDNKFVTTFFDITERKQAEEAVRHNRDFLLALSQAAQAVQQARTPEEVFRAVGEQIKALGFNATMLMLDHDGNHLIIRYTTFAEKVIRASEKLTGLSIHNYRFPISEGNTYRRVLTGGKVEYLHATGAFVTDALPKGLRPLTDPLARILKLDQGIIAPLRVDQETLGLLAISGSGMSREDLSGMDTFAAQVALSLQNVRLMQNLQEELTARQQAEKAVRATGARLNGIITSAMDAIISVDAEQHIILFNTAAEKMFGWTALEVMGQPLDRCIPAPFQTAHRAQIRNFGQTALTRRTMENLGTVTGLRSNGEEFPVEVSISQIEMDGEKINTAILRDITERKRADEALRMSKERLQALLQNSADLIAVIDKEGILQYCSPASERVLGYTSEEVLGRNFMEWVHPEDHALAFASLANRSLESGTAKQSIEVRGLHKNGTWRVIEVLGTNSLENPVIQGIVLNMRDITERKQADEIIRASEARFATVFQASPIPIAITRLNDNHLIDVNPAWEALTGWAKEDALRHSPTDLGIWLDPLERERMVQLLKEQGAIHDFEFNIKHKSGKPSSLLMSAELVTMGEVPSMLSLALDITARQQAERELRHRTEDLTLINAVNDAGNRGEGLDGIAEVFARETRRIFGCQDVAIYLLSPDGKEIEMQVASLSPRLREMIEKIIGRPIPKIQIPLREDGFFNRFLTHEQGTIISNPEEMQQWMEEFTETTSLPLELRATFRQFIPKIYTLLNIRSALIMPLISFKGTIGLLDISSKNLFSEEDLQRIRNLSFQITTIILRKQAERQAQLQLKRMRAVNEIDSAITSSLDMGVSLSILLSEVLSQLGVDSASILILNPSNYMLEYLAGKGFRTPSIRQTRVRLGEGIVGQIGLERKTMHIPNLSKAGNDFKRGELLKDEGFVE